MLLQVLERLDTLSEQVSRLEMRADRRDWQARAASAMRDDAPVVARWPQRQVPEHGITGAVGRRDEFRGTGNDRGEDLYIQPD